MDQPISTSAMPINQHGLIETHLPLPNRRQGKVRDIYEIPAQGGQPPRVAIIATDRISAFDVVMPTPIPGKGQILTDVSVRWFDLVSGANLIPHHLLSTDPRDLPGLEAEHHTMLEGRLIIGRAVRVIPVECVVRGYLAGSGWNEYQATGQVCGVPLPSGLPLSGRLPEPIFTPATKEDIGKHDENISMERATQIAGDKVMRRLREVSMAIYNLAAAYAEARGVILADTKFEFGCALDERGEPTDEIILVDEILTPDSSRYWPQESYQPGIEQASFDKQFVRNYLLELVAQGRWDRAAPGPALPPEIVAQTLERYREARRRLFNG